MFASSIYLINRFGYRTIDFLKHWYWNSLLLMSNVMLNLFEELDYTFALRVTLKNFFKPLYQDATFIGYIMGFILRSFRLTTTLMVYGAVFIVSVFIYLLWLLTIPYIIYKIIIYAQ